MRRCPNCGKAVGDNMLYCPECGSKLAGVGEVPFRAPPAQPIRSKKKIPKGIIIATVTSLSVIFLIVVLLVVFLLGKGCEMIKGPADAANGFMRALSSSDIEAAWDYVSSEGKKAEGKESFERKLKQTAGKISNFYTRNIHAENDFSEISMEVRFTNGEKTFWVFRLVREDGAWKVLGINPESGIE